MRRRLEHLLCTAMSTTVGSNTNAVFWSTAMNNLTRIFAFLAAVLIAPAALWLAVAAAGQQQYLALARSGFLLIGLFGMLWGLFRRRPSLVVVGIALVAVGFLSYFALPSGTDGVAQADASWLTLKAALCRPLPPLGACRVWHAMFAAFLIINGVLIAREAPPKRIAGANLVFLAAAILAVMLAL